MTDHLRQDQADLLAITDPGPGMRLLDAGCGNGWLAGNAAEAGAYAAGIDTDSVLIEEARRRWPRAEFFAEDLRLFHAVKPFDVVVCRGLLEWLPADEETGGALARLTRPGGRILIESRFNPETDGKMLQEAVALLGAKALQITPMNEYLQNLRFRGFALTELATGTKDVRRFAGIHQE